MLITGLLWTILLSGMSGHFPGKGGNEIMATISVRNRDRKLLEQIELELFPVRLEKEVPPGFRISEIRLLSGLRKMIRVFLFRR